MKPILIHVHVYYPEIWPEIRDLLTKAELPEYDLYITMVENHQQIKDDALKLKPDAKHQIVENRGYDVWPFIHVLKQVNLDDYSLCIKLHTKRNIPAAHDYDLRASTPVSLVGDRWRRYLLSILKPNNIKKIIRAFDEEIDLGMVSNYKIIMPREKGDFAAFHECLKLIQSRGEPAPNHIRYIAGSMFICRAELMKAVQDLPFSASDFIVPTKERPLSLAHVLERYFGWCVTHQGFQIRDAFTPVPTLRLTMHHCIYYIRRFLYRNKITKSGRQIIKLCNIPIYYRKIK